MTATASTEQRRVLLVSRTHYRFPLAGAEARKFAALDERMDWRVLGRASTRHEDGRLRLVGRSRPAALDGLLFQLRLPFTLARQLRRWQPDVVVAQDPYLGAAALVARRLAHADGAVVVEVHGDWRTATRLYGSRARRILSAPAGFTAGAAIRHADSVRTISGYTSGLVRELRDSVDAEFPTFLDLGPFLASPVAPLPERPVALFVGVLERYKNVDGLLEAWQTVRERVPGARLRIVGDGRLAGLVADAARRDPTIEHRARLAREEVATALDESTCLVLPSRSEGLGRVVLEAFARGRPVVAAAAGGLREVVQHGRNGLLVPVGHPAALAGALAAVLGDRELADGLAANAAEDGRRTEPTPAAFADALLALVETAARRRERRNRPGPDPVLTSARPAD